MTRIWEPVEVEPLRTAAAAVYRHPLTCEECGCFESKHDSQCSQWAEPVGTRRTSRGYDHE